MNRIKKIFQSLSKTEIRYLKSHLTAFHNKGTNKALLMVRLLEKNPGITQRELSQELYGDPKSKAFIMLKRRLFDKMLEMLSLSAGFKHNLPLKEEPAYYEYIHIQKQLTYVSILRQRGLNLLAKEILQKCFHRSKEAGFHEFSLLALIHMRNISSTKDEVLWHFAHEMDQTQNQLTTDLMGIRLYDEYHILFRDSDFIRQNREDWLTEKLNQLESRLNQAYTVRAHYNYLLLLFSWHECMGNYLQGKEALKALSQLVEQHKGLESKGRLGAISLCKARIEIRSGNFYSALTAANEAIRILGPLRKDFFPAAIYKIFTCIYTGRLAEAKMTIAEISTADYRQTQPILFEVIHYLDSCIAYFSDSIREALIIMSHVNEILSDKRGWNTGLRIHEILLLIDLEEFDLVSARIAALRKHIARYKGDKRVRAIYKYLYLLEKNSFDFQQCRDYLSRLKSQHCLNSPWRAVSYEVIRFESWVRAHENDTSPYSCLLAELDLIKIT